MGFFSKDSSREAFLVFLICICISFSLSGESEITLKGTVIYSFTEPHTLIQTDAYVARVILQRLNANQRKALKGVGSQLKITVPKEAVDLVWPVNPNQNETLVVEGPTRPTVLKEVKGQKNQVYLEGKVLTSFGKSERLIQVGSYIYRIDSSFLSEDMQKQLVSDHEYTSITIPIKAVLFAWKTHEELQSNDRAPAGFKPPFKKERAQLKEEVEISDGKIKITGRSIASFSEPHILVQADGKIYQVRKEYLSADEVSSTGRVGSDVTLKVPLRAIEYSWSSNME